MSSGGAAYRKEAEETQIMGSVLVIGGGAAGLAAAIAAAECGDSVTVLEKMDRVGKKILATGNGRCNLMNTGAPRYPGNAAFAADVLAHCGASEQKSFWEHLGLRLRQEEAGRVYPVSAQASSVLDALRLQLAALHVRVVTGASIMALNCENDGWTAISADGQRFRANRVIVCGGGCAQPKLGSDGSALRLLTSLGCSATPFAPALTQIITDAAPLKGLSGIRVKAQVAVLDGKNVLHEEDGELLFADYGVSGVCVMQCARYAREGRNLRVSLTKGMGFADAGEFRRELHRRRKDWAQRPMTELLTGLCVPRLAAALMRQADWHVAESSLCGQMTADMAERLTKTVDAWMLPIRGVKGFESAQVASGGAAVADFDPATMANRRVPGLYAAGEVLDVDGDCGGFNLMFAFGSGILAGLDGRNAPWTPQNTK